MKTIPEGDDGDTRGGGWWQAWRVVPEPSGKCPRGPDPECRTADGWTRWGGKSRPPHPGFFLGPGGSELETNSWPSAGPKGPGGYGAGGYPPPGGPTLKRSLPPSGLKYTNGIRKILGENKRLMIDTSSPLDELRFMGGREKNTWNNDGGEDSHEDGFQ